MNSTALRARSGPGETAHVRVEYCGEAHDLDPDTVFAIGRGATLDIDNNRYLHRRCLSVQFTDGLWWLVNTGTNLPATVTAGDSGFEARLVPGTRIPLVFGTTSVVISAGPTTYEFAIHTSQTHPTEAPRLDSAHGDTTISAPALTESQLVLIVALAEPLLLRDGTSASAIPGSAAAAARLGWPLTKFNRKLDNVCDKFAQIGITGLRGGAGKLATNRRVRLVEFALATRLVTKADLPMIEEQYGRTTTTGYQVAPTRERPPITEPLPVCGPGQRGKPRAPR